MSPPQREGKPSMAARARDELAKRLAGFWADRVRKGTPIFELGDDGLDLEFARFIVELRILSIDHASELTMAEMNVWISRLVPRFTDFIEIADQARTILERLVETDQLTLGEAMIRIEPSPPSPPLGIPPYPSTREEREDVERRNGGFYRGGKL